MNNNIILIGFMGCGKTTIGKKIMKKLDYHFIDTDQKIQEEQGKAISDIFSENGQDYFRELETKFLVRMNEELKDTVLSTGGGMPLREENAELLKHLGYVVYLTATDENTYNRLKDDTTRPLLQGDNVLEKIKNLQIQRRPLYQRAAHISVATDGKSINSIVDEILGGYYENFSH